MERKETPLRESRSRSFLTRAQRPLKLLRMSHGWRATWTLRLLLKVSMAIGLSQFGGGVRRAGDLSGIRCVKDSSTGKMDFQSAGAGGGCELSDNKGWCRRGGLAAAPLALCKPGGEGGILDTTLAGENRGAEAAGLKGDEHLLLVLLCVTGAADIIGFDDDADGLIRDGFHRSQSYPNSRSAE